MSGLGEERCLPIENTALITRRIRPGTRVASSPSMMMLGAFIRSDAWLLVVTCTAPTWNSYLKT